MKANFKPLGLAAAVATATAGFTGAVVAQERSDGNLGDLAIVPYYTVQGDWTTGVHIINSGDTTQVVKLRLRRASDSADALDFNIILSPKDHWAGNIDDASGNIVITTVDNTCTAPITNGSFPMSAIYRDGAEEGYIEIIQMGQPDSELAPIAYAAKHVNGVPRDCGAVASNFFANVGKGGQPAVPQNRGNIDNATTHQTADAVTAQQFIAAGAVCLDAAGNPIAPGPPSVGGVCQNTYNSDDNPIKVAFHIRDQSSGVEFGGDAVHVADFSGDPWMTNQETGLFSGDPYGFDYPDLDGGPLVFPGTTGLRGAFDDLRDPTVMGVSELLNDWSINPALGVTTDWVVTMPGQYAMLDYVIWLTAGLDPANCARLDNPVTAQNDAVPACDFRDIPVLADLTLYDREEGEILPESGDLVISPQPPGQVNQLQFPYEVNVVEWTDGSSEGVLSSEYATSVDASVLGNFGWANLAVSPANKPVYPDTSATGQSICQAVPTTVSPIVDNTQRAGVCRVPATDDVAITGFVAWQRSFPATPDRSYGRLIDHSFVVAP
tara:strand:- start:44333 stop:45982 length:1650 start_codon:yes stop_codon:yes gene_type:complete